MKTSKQFLLGLFLLSVTSGFCQSLTSPTVAYKTDLTNSDGDVRLFNNKMLNILFANKIGTAFGGSNDLSLQKFYASLDAGDTSLSIGTNFDSRCGDETKKLSWVFSSGVKLKAKDKFATVYKDGDFQEDNIGTTLKISFIGNGIINFNDSKKTNKKKQRKNAIDENRSSIIKKYNDKTNDFNTKELAAFKATQSNLMPFDDEIKSVQSQLDAKTTEDYIAMAKEEIDYIEKNKMYRFLFDHWYSLELFTPFGENIYKTTNSYATQALEDNHFYAISATLSANMMMMFSSGESIFFKAKINTKRNNTILVDNLTATAFQTTQPGVGGVSVVTDSNDGYLVADYKQFWTPNLTIEPAFFALNNTIGISPAVEWNTGDYRKTNWKLGIPISLKDKDGKPKINFEIQWKEINTSTTNVHLVGISANFLFGELIN